MGRINKLGQRVNPLGVLQIVRDEMPEELLQPLAMAAGEENVRPSAGAVVREIVLSGYLVRP